MQEPEMIIRELAKKMEHSPLHQETPSAHCLVCRAKAVVARMDTP